MHARPRHQTNSGNGFRALAFAITMLAQASGVSAQTAEIRLVALPSASLSDSVTTLPTSSIRFLEDAPFIVEVWAQTPDNRGLSSVSADFTFTSTLANINNITHSPLFNVLTAGTVNNTNGTVDNLSGSHLGPCTDAVGASPIWARVAILGVTPTGIGTLSIQSGSTNSPIYGTAICGMGNIADGQIVFGAVAASLVECLTDVECDDGQFCNGAETCNPTTYVCAAGTPPVCNDNIACTVDTCDPLANGGAGTCAYTPNNALCDNLLFCDGVETCGAIQGCLAGAAPCSAECEHCVEDADACDHCIFDLDGSAVMGTGDFSFFAPCFGACYPPGNPCMESNFDGDLAGCIGTSDFAAFAGCFGFTCGQCSGCSGPGGGMTAGGAISSTLALDSPAALVRLVTRRAPTASDTLWAPPHSDSIFTIGEHIYFEVWASNQSVNPLNLGLASAFVDLQFGERQLALLEVIPSDALGLLAGHSISTKDGMLRALGGCAQLGGKGVGAIGSWVRVTTVVARAVSPGRTQVAVESSDELHGFSLVGMFENIDSSLIDFQGATIEVQKDRRTRAER